MSELLVMGLDLATGRQVHIDERPITVWKTKDLTGSRSLVCLYCYHGTDLPEPRVVPLVAKGRLGGRRRAHFAHPPGCAPATGHHPETQWHLQAKTELPCWARRQSEVGEAWVEVWTPDRQRRSDVSLTLTNGRRIAIEVQRAPLTDFQWLQRHHDYRANGIADVWLWHPAIGVPTVALAAGLMGWLLDATPWRLRRVSSHENRNNFHDSIALEDLSVGDLTATPATQHIPSTKPTAPTWRPSHRPGRGFTPFQRRKPPRHGIHPVVRVNGQPDPAGNDRFMCVPCNLYFSRAGLRADRQHVFDPPPDAP